MYEKGMYIYIYGEVRVGNFNKGGSVNSLLREGMGRCIKKLVM